MIRQAYPSDLTDAQWEIVKAIVPAPKSGGRPAKYSRREVLNALLYLERTGCQWRALPHDLPPWKLVYWYYMGWRGIGLLDRIHFLVDALEKPDGNSIQSQSIRRFHARVQSNQHFAV